MIVSFICVSSIVIINIIIVTIVITTISFIIIIIIIVIVINCYNIITTHPHMEGRRLLWEGRAVAIPFCFRCSNSTFWRNSGEIQ